MGKGKLLLGGLAVVVVLGAYGNLSEQEGRPFDTPTGSAADYVPDEAESDTSEASATTSTTPEVDDPAGAGTEVGMIASVLDGDTFRLTDGRNVRVLGIDSCEMVSNSGQQAKEDAQRLLPVGRRVTLTREAGVDRDVFRRHLRYVTTSDGQDFGTAMIGYEHTGVYEGGDAAATYTAQLRRLDDGPKDCDFLTPATSTTSPPPTTTATSHPNPEPEPRPAPAPERAPEPERQPQPEPEPDRSTGSNCHPSYSPCVPDGPDLDCADIRHLVLVTGPDEFRLDGDDNDGRGCESYG